MSGVKCTGFYKATITVPCGMGELFQMWCSMAARLVRRDRRARFRLNQTKVEKYDLDDEYTKRWGTLQKTVCACGGEMVTTVKKTRSADEGGQIVLVCKVCGQTRKIGVT